ncbi:cell shape determination protein CcmA [Kineobactrum sediminis]|uniref:Cell shape determination protein CcmA n=1 Tax=Kineobactrum sediminis TaxID=1905677 RepID=A0A2N5XY66_9GAMM|nr:polymer-forming cytoskeletal protein [Kineobactrum sediminis]PLW81094.1 cell shape determination protein CcmA [Kineobactrum sediminis]
MLGSKRNGTTATGGTTLISKDTIVNGDISFSGNLEVEGEVKGNILSEQDQEAMVRVVESGRVEGEIRAPRVTINGTVEGSIHASQHLELAPHARVMGDIHYNLVEMSAGAEVNGRLLHTGEAVAGESGNHSGGSVDTIPEPEIASIALSGTKVD